jgi:hypothetical protein
MMDRGISHRLSVIAVLLLAVSACSKQAPAGEPGAVVEIRTAIDGTPGATKGVITGTDFPNWSGRANDPTGTFGIFSCLHEDVPSEFAAHKVATYNARGYKAGSALRYHYVATSGSGALEGTYSNSFILTQRKDDKTADLYAYAPWTVDAWESGPTAIPFETVKQWDWMYAVENNRPYLTPMDANDRENSDLDPAGTDLKASFYFRHAMARLRFEFRLLNTPTDYQVRLVSVTRSSGAPLYGAGTFNAITGTFENLVETDSLTPDLTEWIRSTAPAAINLLLVPGEIGPTDELILTFSANGRTLEPFVLTRDRVAHGDGVTYGLKAGYTYTYHFTMDNYIFLDGFTINTEWTTPGNPDDDLNPIHI